MEAKELKRVLQRIATLDRRFVYLLVGLAVALPFFFPLSPEKNLPILESSPGLFSLSCGGACFWLSMIDRAPDKSASNCLFGGRYFSCCCL